MIPHKGIPPPHLPWGMSHSAHPGTLRGWAFFVLEPDPFPKTWYFFSTHTPMSYRKCHHVENAFAALPPVPPAEPPAQSYQNKASASLLLAP